MRKNIIPATIFAAMLLGVAIAEVNIIHPRDLKKKLGNDGVIKSSLANFGHIVYDTSIVR